MAKAKKQAVKKIATVLINFVLDKSGSMGSCITDTIGGFNTYIGKLKDDKKAKYKFSLTLFDTAFENRHVAVALTDVPELTTKTYVPGGMTALYDAIGKAVGEVEAKGDKSDKVLTVILTDGQENSSREYKLQSIKDLITRKEKEGNWSFVFLGADISAFAVGDQLGVALSNSVVYNQQNMTAAYANTATATMDFACSVGSNTRDFYKTVPRRAMAAAGMKRRVR